MSNDISDWLKDIGVDNSEEVVTKKKKESTLSLPVELMAMDTGDKQFYANLSDEHKKEISLWVLMRFMSSSQNDAEDHLITVNELVNVNFSDLSKHPELQWKLLALCGSGKKQYHPWIPPPKGSKKNPLEAAILTHYPLLRDDELEMLLSINTQEDLEEFFRENGYEDKTIKELFKKNSKGK